MNIFKKIEKKNYSFISQKNNLICLLIIILIFVSDRISKIKIINHQIDNNRVYINDFMNFDLVWNTGIGFGLLSFDQSLFYNAITSLIVLINLLIIYMIIKTDDIRSYFLVFVLGGSLGNLFDRLYYSAVPDFIDINYEDFHWFIFNVADIFITFGIICLIFAELMNYKSENEN